MLNANTNVQRFERFQDLDICASLATSLSLQYASPELSYWTIWFMVYGSCTNGDEVLP